MSFVDVGGNDIKVGDYFVYAALLGRSAVLKYGRVTDLIENRTVFGRGRVLAITVEYSPFTNTFCLQKEGKPIPLHFPNRMCIIPLGIIPVEVYMLLRP